MASLWTGSERPLIFLVKDKIRNPFIWFFGGDCGCRFGLEWCLWITKRQQDEKPNDPCYWMVGDTVKPYPLIFIIVTPDQLWITLSIIYPYKIAFHFWVHPMVNIAMKQPKEKQKVNYTLHTLDWVTTRIM